MRKNSRKQKRIACFGRRDIFSLLVDVVGLMKLELSYIFTVFSFLFFLSFQPFLLSFFQCFSFKYVLHLTVLVSFLQERGEQHRGGGCSAVLGREVMTEEG